MEHPAKSLLAFLALDFFVPSLPEADQILEVCCIEPEKRKNIFNIINIRNTGENR